MSIIWLMGGETSHNTTPKLIQMRIPLGNLAGNDEENVSVFASHFKKVLNNHKPTDTILINDIHLQEVVDELGVLTSCTEFISAIQELTNDKSPGLNGVASYTHVDVPFTRLNQRRLPALTSARPSLKATNFPPSPRQGC